MSNDTAFLLGMATAFSLVLACTLLAIWLENRR